jgi:hypothetical protein
MQRHCAPLPYFDTKYAIKKRLPKIANHTKIC